MLKASPDLMEKKEKLSVTEGHRVWAEAMGSRITKRKLLSSET